MPALSREQTIECIEILEEQSRRQTESTVIDLVCPRAGLTHAIVKHSGKWITTQDKPDIYLPAKMERVVKSDKRFIIIIGGRGSAKSVSVADICEIKAKDDGIKTFCLREYQS